MLGTNAIFAYEAVAGVRVNTDPTNTDEVDCLFNARSGLTLATSADLSPSSLLRLLKKFDRSFKRSNQKFRAVNADGYFVDLITSLRNPSRPDGRLRVGADADEYFATETARLNWLEAPSFEAIAIDEKGEPVRIVAIDPRVWVAHRLWLSKRKHRKPLERRRDREVAHTIGRLVAEYMPHLPFTSNQLPMLPKSLLMEVALLSVVDDTRLSAEAEAVRSLGAFGRDDANMQLAQLLCCDFRRRAHQQIFGALVHREQHDLPKILLAT